MPSPRLTIVVCLKDRFSYTKRFMRWLERCGCPYPIVFADGGVNPEVEPLLSDPKSFPSLTYEYHRFPPDDSYQRFYDKSRNILDKVATPYVVAMDNDDFLLPERLDPCIAFLDTQPEYSCCGGPAYTLDLDKAYRPSRDHLLGNANALFWLGFDPNSQEHDDPGERVLNLLGHYYGSTWYNVIRREHAVALWAEMARINYNLLVSAEEHYVLGLAALGKIRQDFPAHLVRQAETSDGGDLMAEAAVRPDEQPWWGQEMATLRESMAELAGKAGDAEYAARYDQAIQPLLRDQLPNPNRKVSATKKLRRKVERTVPGLGIALRTLSRWQHFAFSSRVKERRKATAKLLAKDPALVALRDFLRGYTGR